MTFFALPIFYVLLYITFILQLCRTSTNFSLSSRPASAASTVSDAEESLNFMYDDNDDASSGVSLPCMIDDPFSKISPSKMHFH